MSDTERRRILLQRCDELIGKIEALSAIAGNIFDIVAGNAQIDEMQAQAERQFAAANKLMDTGEVAALRAQCDALTATLVRIHGIIQPAISGVNS